MRKTKNVASFVLMLSLLLTLSPGTALAQGEIGCETDVIVQADDWLSKIADKFYGDVLAFEAISEATNSKAATDSSYTEIVDVNVIEPGWKSNSGVAF